MSKKEKLQSIYSRIRENDLNLLLIFNWNVKDYTVDIATDNYILFKLNDERLKIIKEVIEYEEANSLLDTGKFAIACKEKQFPAMGIDSHLVISYGLVYGDWKQTGKFQKTSLDITKQDIDLIFSVAPKNLRTIQEATPLAERIEWTPDIRKIRVTSVPMDNTNLWNVILDKLHDTNATLQNNPSISNSHAALISEFEQLVATVQRYTDSPQRVHDEIETTLEAMQWLVEKDEIPDDLVTRRSKKTLTDCVLDIRGDIPEVSIVIKKRTALRFYQLPDDDRNKIHNITEEVIPYIEDERTKEDMRQDADALTEQQESDISLKYTSSIYRLLSRLSRMIELLEANVPDFVQGIAIVIVSALILRMIGLA